MGSLALPAAGPVYTDAQVLIYSVERHPVYAPLLRPLWAAVQAAALEVISSELVVLETLVAPLKTSDQALIGAYDQLFQQAGFRLLPITRPILRSAAQLRATTRLRTPDALHAATAILAGCASFITNDKSFRGVPGLPLAILDDIVNP